VFETQSSPFVGRTESEVWFYAGHRRETSLWKVHFGKSCYSAPVYSL